MITRAGNATKRPGEVLTRNGVRRPKQVIEAERIAKAAKKAKAAATKDAAINKLARLENDARQKVNRAKPKGVSLGGNAIGQTSTRARKALLVADKGKLLTINKP